MRKLLTLLLASLSITVFAQSYSSPESVEYDLSHNRWLISCTGSSTIQQRSASGVISQFVSVTSPYGLEIMGDSVYVCSSGRIKGFSLNTGAQGTNLQIPGAAFLNGITSDGVGNLYVTDFNGYKIYHVNIAGQYVSTFANLVAAPSPNGIILDAPNNRLVFVHWGANAPIKAVSLVDSSVSTLVAGTGYGSIDGIARDASGNFYISSWGSQKIFKYDNAFTATGVAVVSTGLNNPADIYYATSLDTLGVPNAGNNTVTFYGFAPLPNNSIAAPSATGGFSNLCIPSNFTLNFAALGTYTVGNTFYAVLSDAMGNFANADTIGSLAAMNSGPMSCSLTTILPGSNYRIKVISTNPPVVGVDNGADIALDYCLGIEAQIVPIITMIPNPAEQFVYLRGGETKFAVYVFNALGQQVYVDSTYSSEKDIPVNYLRKGIYFIRLETNTGFQTKHFLKN